VEEGNLKDYSQRADTLASRQVLPMVDHIEGIKRHVGDLLREQMRLFHDLLRQKPASLFILLGWSLITMASLPFPAVKTSNPA
jgi:hypothetical protein